MATDQVEMDTSTTAQGAAKPAPPITEDFLLQSLKLNTDHIIKSFTNHVNMLSQRVNGNAALITDNSASIAKQATTVADQGAELSALSSRVADLERGGAMGANQGVRGQYYPRITCSHAGRYDSGQSLEKLKRQRGEAWGTLSTEP